MITWYACAYTEAKWLNLVPVSRRSVAEALVTVTIALTGKEPAPLGGRHAPRGRPAPAEERLGEDRPSPSRPNWCGCCAPTSSGTAPPRRADLPDNPGGLLQDSGHNEVWTEARKNALTPALQRSPLGWRPFDPRHAAVPLWLNSGVPATEVARRAGHGVAVLLKIYAHCIDGQADAANQRITDALGTTEADQDPGDEGDDNSEPAA